MSSALRAAVYRGLGDAHSGANDRGKLGRSVASGVRVAGSDAPDVMDEEDVVRARRVCRQASTTMCFAAVVILALSAACLRDPLRPHRGDPAPWPLALPDIDITPEWSHDGRFVAYQRWLPSSDGPAGIYIVSASGGTPRFVTRAGYCQSIRFSPDDRSLAIARDDQLAVIDLGSGAEREPVHATFGITSPDWSPDGTMIAYQRWGSTNVAPRESIGIHIIDLRSGEERSLAYHDTLQLGADPVWTPEGDAIAVRQNLDEFWRLAIIRTDGSSLKTILRSTLGGALWNLHRHHDVRLGSGLVVNGTAQSGGPPAFVAWIGGVVQSLPREFWSNDVYSYDGLRGVGSRYDARDSLTALFTFKTGDLTGATYHQITHYTPAAGIASSLLGTDPAQ